MNQVPGSCSEKIKFHLLNQKSDSEEQSTTQFTERTADVEVKTHSD